MAERDLVISRFFISVFVLWGLTAAQQGAQGFVTNIVDFEASGICCLDLDNAERPVVTYIHAEQDFMIATLDEPCTVYETVAFIGLEAKYTYDFAVDSINGMGIAYVVNNRLYFTYKFPGTAWSEPVELGEASSRPSMAFDEYDIPHIAWVDAHYLKLGYFNPQTSFWQVETVIHDNSIIKSDLALDGAGGLAVVGFGPDASIRLFMKRSLGWQELASPGSGGCSVDFTINGNIAIARIYEDNTLYYAEYISQVGWQEQEIAGWWWGIGEAVLKAGASGYPDIVYNIFQGDIGLLSLARVYSSPSKIGLGNTGMHGPRPYDLEHTGAGEVLVAYIGYDGAVRVTGQGLVKDRPEDLDGDGKVDMFDFKWFTTFYDEAGWSENPADVNGDGQIDAADLAELAGNWLGRHRRYPE